MPWKETDIMNEKERFVMLAQTGRFTMTDLCADFGISRKTGHKYLQRYDADGHVGLNDLSRRPKRCPFTTSAAVEKLILKERRKHPTWGAKKIHNLLLTVHGLEDRPHINTINNILNRNRVEKGSVQFFMFFLRRFSGQFHNVQLVLGRTFTLILPFGHS